PFPRDLRRSGAPGKPTKPDGRACRGAGFGGGCAEGGPAMIDRRRLLVTAAAGAGLAAAGGPAFARSEADDRLDALLSRWFDEDVDNSPEMATNLGLDRGERAHLSGKLSDRGEAAWMGDRARA